MPDDVTSLRDLVANGVRAALDEALPAELASFDPLVRPSDHADFQANAALPLGKRLRRPPRELAGELAHAMIEQNCGALDAEVSGPGFINVTLNDEILWHQLSSRAERDRYGIPLARRGQRTVVDYSGPNIAKEMHVGHLRTTIIGDSIVRVLSYLGADVIRQNHLGDWGTQFGMLIQYITEFLPEGWKDQDSDAISRLDALYRKARHTFDADPEFARRASRRVTDLQSGDPDTIEQWNALVVESEKAFEMVYRRLNVLLTNDDSAGESKYNSLLPSVVDELRSKGIAEYSDRALCVFFDDVRGADGERVPLIVQKADGGFGYAATDLATIRYRAQELKADRILYVVDARQALHFRMVFETARRAGWIDEGIDVQHVAFGTVLGPDGKPFKTRSGETVRLGSLLDDAVDHARAEIVERGTDFSNSELSVLAEAAGVGAVKYADLATSRTKDYVFDAARMVSFQGNTGLYLQYANARIASILRRAGNPEIVPGTVDASVPIEPAERALILHLDRFGEALDDVAETLEPHRLCGYTYQLARTFTEFYENCPVLQNNSDTVRKNRLLLCQVTGSVLETSLSLLGIAAPSRI